MVIKRITIVVACAFFAGGCGKSPTTTSSNSQPAPPIQAEPFHGQVYTSLDGATVLTLTSPDECELTGLGTTTLCKYTKPNGTLRVVLTVQGTVVYFRYTDEGIVDNSGLVLYSPDKYAAARATLQQQRQRVIDEQQAFQRKTDEYQRHLQALVKSENSTLWYFKGLALDERIEDMQGVKGYNGWPLTKSPTELSLYDTCLELAIGTYPTSRAGGGPYTGTIAVFFHQIKKIGDLGEDTQSDSFFVDGDGLGSHGASPFPPHLVLHFKSEADARKVHDTLVQVYATWAKKFPDAVLTAQ